MGRFERIANQRIYQQIVDQISRLVHDGVLRPGDRLPPERQLAEEFGVSRAAVREALTALTMMGMLEVRAGEGTYVRSVTEEGLVNPLALLLTMERNEALGLELLEIRVALESEAAYLAARRREPDDLAAMENALEEMEASLHSGDLGAEADWRFHHAVAAATGNGLLLQVMQQLSDTMNESLQHYRQRLLRIPGQGRDLLDEHHGILDAIRNRNADLAHERMRTHIERVKKTLYGDTAAHPTR